MHKRIAGLCAVHSAGPNSSFHKSFFGKVTGDGWGYGTQPAKRTLVKQSVKQATLTLVLSASMASWVVSGPQDDPGRPSPPRGLRVVEVQWPMAIPTNPLTPGNRDLVRERPAHIIKATDILEKEVLSPVGEKLAKIGELAVDIETGRVILVILSVGGVSGVGETRVAVPPDVVKDISKTVFQLNVDAEKFKSAPLFEMAKWEEYWEINRVIEVYRYFGREPSLPLEGIKHVAKATGIIGSSIRNHEGEKVGFANDLIVDLAGGRVVFLILVSGNLPGSKDEFNAVPPAAFYYEPSRCSLVLNFSKEDLERAPRFKRSQWPEFHDSAYVVSVYQAYRVEPCLAIGGKPATTTPDALDALAPLDQGIRDADVMLTRKIRREIVARDDLSVNARKVKIITRDGRVTLRGPVHSENEKRALEEIARQIAGYLNVDNRLEVKRDVPAN